MATAPGKDLVMAIDQGTSSSRALVFDATAAVVAGAQLEFPQIFPGPGWVEHDPEAIWQSVSVVCKETAAKVDARRIAGLGITNQRETTFVWNRDSGKCIHNAIVWQDRRTADRCQRLIDDDHEDLVRSKTGLRLDPYFSATKLGWVLENVSGARKLAEQGKLAFGTADSFLLWRLTGGKCHATDATNASRTLLFNIHDQSWDEELLRLFDIPPGILPEVRDCADDYGMTDPSMLGVSVPIGGVAGDQHAALIGQAAFDPGVTKSTYGTGCFVMTNTGAVALTSRNNLLTTVAYRLQGKTTYGIEGSIFVAGSAIQWLRDKLGIIKSADATEALAVATGPVEDIHVVPAFAGLGAPYWDANARGAILGLSRGSGIPEIVTATLQSIAYQTRDLVTAMSNDGIELSVIRVDGGMVRNDWFLQFLADLLNLPVERPQNIESTVLGAATLAGLQAGVFGSLDDIARSWSREAVFEPNMPDETRNRLYDGWLAAVDRIRTNS